MSSAVAPASLCASSGLSGKEIRRVDRDGDAPGDHAADQGQGADIEADDVADAEQRGRQVGAEIRQPLAEEPACGRRVGNQAQAAARGQLREAAAERRQAEYLHSLRRVVAGLEHLGRRHAFRELEALVDDQRAAQGHREEHAEDAAEARDREHPQVPEVRPVAEDHQRRDGEDHARGDGRSRRRAGLHDVVLEDRAAAEDAQHGHRDHRGRDRRGDRQAGKQAKVGVCSSEHHREHDRERDGAERELGGDGGLVHRDLRCVIGHACLMSSAPCIHRTSMPESIHSTIGEREQRAGQSAEDRELAEALGKRADDSREPVRRRN